MKHSAAFFDVDDTLINIKSMFDFFDFWCRYKNKHSKLESYMSHFRNEVKRGTPRETLNREYYQQFSGENYKDVEDAGEKWFRYKLNSGIFIGSAVAALKKHQSEEVNIVFISGSMQPVLAPIAKYLGVKDIICAPLKLTRNDVITGEIGFPQTIGAGKKDALIDFCNQRNIDPRDCYAYGDDMSDIPMLASAGHPVCVGKHTALAKHAANKKWQII